MVGFGTALRKARRPGWEEAYFDYENLKLLLTQIEAVYEEEAHLQKERDGDIFGERSEGRDSHAKRDYRDELFLESDSDEAFEILMKYDYYSANEDNSDMEEQLEMEQQMPLQPQPSSSHINSVFSDRDQSRWQHGGNSNASAGGSALPFSLTSYSQDPRRPELLYGDYGHSYEDDDEDSQDDIDANCVPLTAAWGSNKLKKKPSPTTRSTKHRPKKPRGGSGFLSPMDRNNEFFVSTTTSKNKDDDAFILDSGTAFAEEDTMQSQDNGGMSTLTSFYQSHDFENAPSILKKPFRRTSSANEKTSLLSAPNKPAAGSSLYSFASHTGPITPPESGPMFTTSDSRRHSEKIRMPVFTDRPALTKAQQEKLEARRKEERRQRRRKKRQRAKERKALEQKVPRHIRVAHTKARDITERFLGLLRAECEKVMLFAQSCLGELADTVGSLRFPNMEDLHPNNQAAESVPLSPNSNAGMSYDGYPLSDGGMHPSASSSSEDGVSGNGTFYWSDSSTNDSGKSDQSGNSPRRSLMKDLHRRNQSISSAEYESNERSERRESLASSKQRHAGFDFARRHLDHFEKLRRERPIFQRSGHIVGEDLLLLSAVDEADGYTAVGVELMHVLRFICVNLIAVRKICRKHDRLLMNRMLGGYYHHLRVIAAAADRHNQQEVPKISKRMNQGALFKDEHLQNAQTLGGLLARESGDIFEAHHPDVIGQMNGNYKLVGLYDQNLQQLANSRTVQVISSCLVLALSEYEVSRSRANALATLNTAGSGPEARRDSANRIHQQHYQQQDQMSVLTGFDNSKPAAMDAFDEKDEGMDSDDSGGPPSTESSISLTRLRFTVTSIIAMRQAARRKQNMYATYLSRSMLAFTGRAVLGEGLDGCSRDTLDFLVSHNPDASFLMDPATLNEGLKQGMWSKRAISSVMASSLAIATTPVELPHGVSTKKLVKQEKAVMDALNILPKGTFLKKPQFFKSQLAKKSSASRLENEAFRSVLRINRMSNLLYNMNYYVVHPTTITFVEAVASPAAHSAMIIGAPSLSAIFVALFHCYVLSGTGKAPLKSFRSSRWLFIMAAIFGTVGNGVHIYGIWNFSVPYAVLGRLLLGFSSCEILHRHLVASCLPMPVNRIVWETATLVQAQVLGISLGLAVGTLADYLPYHIASWGVRSLSSSSWFMGSLWLVHLFTICFLFTVEGLDSRESMEARNAAEVEQLLTSSKPSVTAVQETDSSDSGRLKSGEDTLSNSLQLAYGSTGEQQDLVNEWQTSNNERTKKKKKRRGKGRKRRIRTLKSFPSRLRGLLSYSIGVPLCLCIILYVKFAQEVLFSSCPIILDRYFRWGGGRAGIFLACLTLSIPATNFICGHIARKYEERTVIKRSVVFLGIGLFVMINFGSFIALALQITELLKFTTERQHDHRYDWLLGIFQYFLGFATTFVGLTAMDGASLSLLSKVCPPRIRSSSVALQVGTIVSFVGMVARVLADLQILMIGLSHRLINTDLVNSLVIPLFIVCFIVGHFVRKHFFFLI